MSLFRGIMSRSAIVALAVAAGVGCGGSTNNDQGTSFLATGYFNGTADTSARITRANALLSLDVALLQITTDRGAQIPVDGNVLTAALGVQNRLSTQFLNVTRIDCSYDVPGSSLVIPGDSIPVAATIEPAATRGDAVDDNGADGSATSARAAKIDFPIITPDLFAYLNTNRDVLPELPFRMIISCTAVGIAQSGDVFTTNPVAFPVFFFDNAECCTGTGVDSDGGFQDGTGTGGEFDSFGDPDDSSSSTSTGTSTSAITDEGEDFVIE